VRPAGPVERERNVDGFWSDLFVAVWFGIGGREWGGGGGSYLTP
jgi:hypothetical protein